MSNDLSMYVLSFLSLTEQIVWMNYKKSLFIIDHCYYMFNSLQTFIISSKMNKSDMRSQVKCIRYFFRSTIGNINTIVFPIQL
jgi:hypothetical protein